MVIVTDNRVLVHGTWYRKIDSEKWMGICCGICMFNVKGVNHIKGVNEVCNRCDMKHYYRKDNDDRE